MRYEPVAPFDLTDRQTGEARHNDLPPEKTSTTVAAANTVLAALDPSLKFTPLTIRQRDSLFHALYEKTFESLDQDCLRYGKFKQMNLWDRDPGINMFVSMSNNGNAELVD